MSSLIQISEIFGPTIQGEGALIGRPTIFVRAAGCDYRCDWCDTLFAVDTSHAKHWRKMSPQNILDEIDRLSQNTPMSITLSGGNPALQPFEDLIDLGQAKGYEFVMETQGSLVQDWFSKLDVLTLSPKPPSSKMTTDWAALSDCIQAAGPNTQVALKIVIFDGPDYEYAQHVSSLYPDLSLYLQPGNHSVEEQAGFDLNGVLDRLRWLAEKVAQDRWQKACVLPQLHLLAWGNQRGV